MPRILLVVLLLTITPLAARDDAFVPDAGPPTPKSVQRAPDWSEGRFRLPPWPDPADLVAFPIDGPDRGFRYAIDARNLVIGDDDVVRYTLVVESASGARNVSFEGIRCTASGRYQVYAYGVGGVFKPLSDSDWRPIPKDGTEQHRYDLWHAYLCSHPPFAPRRRSEILHALRHGRPSGLDSAGFMAD